MPSSGIQAYTQAQHPTKQTNKQICFTKEKNKILKPKKKKSRRLRRCAMVHFHGSSEGPGCFSCGDGCISSLRLLVGLVALWRMHLLFLQSKSSLGDTLLLQLYVIMSIKQICRCDLSQIRAFILRTIGMRLFAPYNLHNS